MLELDRYFIKCETCGTTVDNWKDTENQHELHRTKKLGLDGWLDMLHDCYESGCLDECDIDKEIEERRHLLTFILGLVHHAKSK